MSDWQTGAPAVWDLLVVGGGTGGLVAARTAAGFGATVLLVEAGRLGGDCLWTGCVPSKALLAAAHTAAEARNGHRLGVRAQVEVDFGAVMDHVHAATTTIEPTDSADSLRADGVVVALDRLRFTGPTTATVGGTEVRFRQAVLATGSRPVLPPVRGLAEADPLTSDTVWDLRQLPGRLLVLGGGPIGCELGQAFGRLGATVTLVEAADRLLPGEDPDASAVLTAALRRDGLTVRTGTSVEEVTSDGARLSDGTVVAFDRALVATGRRPRTDELGLTEADVALDDRGFVRVDERLRTTNPRIWAAGDITGHPAFTHTAGVHGSLAASNAVLGLRRRVETNATPRVTFTQPEIAAVGAGTGDAARVHTTRHTEVDRAVTDDRTEGFTRLALDRRSRVIGATVVGPRAGESLAELVLAVSSSTRASGLAAAMHAYPTFGDGAWKTAIETVRLRLRRPPARLVLRLLVGLRRATLDRRDP